MVGGINPDDITYSSQNITGSSAASRDKNLFVKVKEKRVPSGRLKKLFSRIKKPNKKTLIMSSVAILVVILAVIAVYILIKTSTETEESLFEDSGVPTGANDVNISTETDEDPEYSEETIAQKNAEYDEQIEKATSNEGKADAYTEKAMYLWDVTEIYEGRDYSEQVLENLNKAEELSPSARTAYNICLFLSGPEETGHSDQEVDYCQITEERDPNFFAKEDENEWV